MRPFIGRDDLTGKLIGRFTVIGMWADTAGGESRWVCRCACGDYEVRSAKTIKSALAGLQQEDSLSFRCYYCHQTNLVKSRYKSKGAKPLSAFINPQAAPAKRQTSEAVITELTGNYEAAVKIVAHLNRAGFRIVREKHETIAEV